MSWVTTNVRKKSRQWAVSVRSAEGEERELTYKSEAQARYFAAVLALGPSRLPGAPKKKIVAKLSGARATQKGEPALVTSAGPTAPTSPAAAAGSRCSPR